MQRLWLALPLLALTLALPARAGGRLDALLGGAERLDSLEAFLARYVGRCTDIYERRTCEENVARVRRAAQGKVFAVRIADAAPLVQARTAGDRFTILLTPFVDGGGLALTNGEPRSQDAEGHPQIGVIPILGTLPPGTMDLDFQSPFRTGLVEMEIVFRPERTWKLRRRGEAGFYEGVSAKFLAVRLVDGRTGAEIASKVL
jgi:hypothetical protein